MKSQVLSDSLSFLLMHLTILLYCAITVLLYHFLTTLYSIYFSTRLTSFVLGDYCAHAGTLCTNPHSLQMKLRLLKKKERESERERESKATLHS